MKQTGFTLWLTGLSCAGKTTLANLLEVEFRRMGLNVEVLDGDVIRTNLSKGLGFSHEDRVTNLKRIGFVCKLLCRNGTIAIAAAISPYADLRAFLRKDIPNYVEAYVNAPLEVCMERDVKGLYAKAKRGEIDKFTGIDDPYEAPTSPDIEIHTDRETPAESAANIISCLQRMGLLPPVEEKAAYAPEEEEVVAKRLESLGYT